MALTHRPIDEKDIQVICSFPQSEDELFFLFPKAAFPLAPSQLQDAIAQRSDSTVVELGAEVVAFAPGRCAMQPRSAGHSNAGPFPHTSQGGSSGLFY